MGNEQNDGAREDILSPIQQELLREASSFPVHYKSKIVKEEPGKRDSDLRRAVFDAVVQLSEVVSENVLRIQLPFLHCTSWDEVIEERFLGSPRLCGFPTCGENIEVQSKKQRYFIDRQARKIYEHRLESDMFCSRSCMLQSASIRAQLPDEPLWLSGDIPRRMCATYRIDGTSDEIEESTKRREVEVVRRVEENFKDLRIREGDSSTESEVEDDPDDEPDVKSYIETVTNLIGDVHERTNTTSKSDINGSTKGTSGRGPNGRRSLEASPSATNPRLPDPQMAPKLSLSSAELEKLSRLRSKYSKTNAKKPIIIDPTPAPFLCTIEKSTAQEEQSSSCAATVSSAAQETLTTVRSLFRGWLTDRTRHLLRSGGLCISDSTDTLMKQFYRPFSEDSAVERNEVLLPSVDSVDVQKKRLHIFLESVRKPLAAYQKELEFSFSKFNWLYVVAATFNLDPTTITNFSINVLKLVCLLLLKLISSLDNAVEDAVFPDGKPSEKFVCCLSKLGIEPSEFDKITLEILESNEENS
ncbi:RTR1-type domain-containing protein [Trichostrongylus colubriformis]|uniref:RNA polymerase II subunit B1 CTD phosphatase RPAP2 homolog n=1 Tax=Trichostrongylus colubriformis TaxID=6319 RepID=A0AAN8FUR8_TRICO